MSNIYLKYKTFDSLLADILGDFKQYALSNLIEPQDLIRVTKGVTRDLGLRIYKTHEEILELHHGKVKLPDDFYIFNYGLLCGEHTITSVIPSGTHVESVPFPVPRFQDIPDKISACDNGSLCPIPNTKYACGHCGHCDICAPTVTSVPPYNPLQPYGDPCMKPRVYMDCKGDAFELIQIIKTETRHYKTMLPLKLIEENQEISCHCPNLYTQCPNHIRIKDGFLHSNLKHGKIYINYQGALEDTDGNLLVLDQEDITEYYEYKLKHRILENLWINGEDTERKMNVMEVRMREARRIAKSLVNTPNFAEMENVWKTNRQAYNSRYVNMFANYGWLDPVFRGVYGRR